MRIPSLLLIAALAVAAASSSSSAAGFPITQSQEELGLKYEISAPLQNGTVILSITISDLGKLKPLQHVVLVIPTANKDSRFDIYMQMATKEENGKIKAWAQLSKEMAERATIELVPEKTPDGSVVFGWVFFSIPVKEHIKPVP